MDRCVGVRKSTLEGGEDWGARIGTRIMRKRYKKDEKERNEMLVQHSSERKWVSERSTATKDEERLDKARGRA